MAVYVYNNKKPHIIICYEGGTCGNFIASLIRTMAKPTYYDDHGHLTSRGSCDHMSGGQRLSYDYAYNTLGHAIYPETDENVRLVSDAIADPDNTYVNYIIPHEREFDFHITTIHYHKPSTIKKFLENQNVFVIYITFEGSDINLLACNFIHKILEKEREKETDKFDFFKDLFTEFQKYDRLEELEKIERLSDLSDSIINDIIECHEQHIIKKSMYTREMGLNDLEQSKRLIKLPFNLIYSDKDATIKILSKFTRFSANESTYRLYEDYMLAQEPILTKLKEKNAKNN